MIAGHFAHVKLFPLLTREENSGTEAKPSAYEHIHACV